MYECIRCGRVEKDYFGPHKPRIGGLRTCSGTVVEQSKVQQTRCQEMRAFTSAMLELGKKECGW